MPGEHESGTLIERLCSTVEWFENYADCSAMAAGPEMRARACSLIVEAKKRIGSIEYEPVPDKSGGKTMFTTPGYGEVMRFEANGDIYVHGKLIENDKEGVEAFREWMRLAHIDPRGVKFDNEEKADGEADSEGA